MSILELAYIFKEKFETFSDNFWKNKNFIMSFAAIKDNSQILQKIIWAGGRLARLPFSPVTKYHFAIHSTYLGCPQFLSALTLRYLKDKECVPGMVSAPPVYLSLLCQLKEKGKKNRIYI